MLFEKPTRAQLANRFSYHAPHGDQASRYERVRGQILATAALLVDLCPAGPEVELALNALDQAMFLFSASIARNAE